MSKTPQTRIGAAPHPAVAVLLRLVMCPHANAREIVVGGHDGNYDAGEWCPDCGAFKKYTQDDWDDPSIVAGLKRDGIPVPDPPPPGETQPSLLQPGVGSPEPSPRTSGDAIEILSGLRLPLQDGPGG